MAIHVIKCLRLKLRCFIINAASECSIIHFGNTYFISYTHDLLGILKKKILRCVFDVSCCYFPFYDHMIIIIALLFHYYHYYYYYYYHYYYYYYHYYYDDDADNDDDDDHHHHHHHLTTRTVVDKCRLPSKV